MFKMSGGFHAPGLKDPGTKSNKISMTRIAMLTGVFILVVGPPKSDSSTGSFFSLVFFFSPFYFPILLLINFYFCAFLVHI